ncbi:MAG: hypothetical protein ABI874_04925 [Chloroflexota bacterium]
MHRTIVIRQTSLVGAVAVDEKELRVLVAAAVAREYQLVTRWRIPRA